MSSDNITRWIEELRQGSDEAAQQLWETYFGELVRVAARQLPAQVKRAFDEEDMAQSAFYSFVKGVERFPQLADRTDLWKLLVVITKRKARSHMRRELRQKRGGGTVRGESAILPGDDDRFGGIEMIVGEQPTPEFAAIVVEQCERLMASLHDASLVQIAQLKMQGYTVSEIASQLALSKRSVERRLHLIRRIWTEEEERLKDE